MGLSTDSVQAKMQLGLRNAVMEALLSQDREYFDHHSSGVLQERLNKDTEVPASTPSSTARYTAVSVRSHIDRYPPSAPMSNRRC